MNLSFTAALCSFSPASAFVHWPVISQHLYIIRSQFTGGLRASSSPIESSASIDTSSFFKFDLSSLTEIDSSNTPPILQTILTSFAELKSGSTGCDSNNSYFVLLRAGKCDAAVMGKILCLMSFVVVVPCSQLGCLTLFVYTSKGITFA